ncbi:MAG: mannitol-1-phosphate 5-dehydrogenase [Treponema sp.]|jgi:mannitol-1-phosphate 5-dehydrogenase|nr:mannitol-1-phosphate 5-dehydrogenase [Treponema sp.]
MKAVMYGAGNIGRGFVGAVFAQSGYRLCFIDVAEETTSALQREGRYPVRILSEEGSEDTWIEGVTAVDGRDIEQAAARIADADIMATAVGVRALPLIAPVIAEGLKARFSGGAACINIIICENLIGADRILAGLIKEHLSEAGRAAFDKQVGLVEASIGRMVPLQTAEMRDGNPLRVCVEAYGFLPVDRAAFKGDPPLLQGLVPLEPFDFYIQRKLFVHNMGHGICAYLGLLSGERFIAVAAARAEILCVAQNAMLESARALSAKYGQALEDLLSHIQDLLCRFSNRALADTCGRVGADTERKLGSNDRFMGAIACCRAQGVIPAFISAGAAAALDCHLREKGLARTPEAALAALEQIAGPEAVSGAPLVPVMYRILSEGGGVSALLREALRLGRKPGVV